MKIPIHLSCVLSNSSQKRGKDIMENSIILITENGIIVAWILLKKQTSTDEKARWVITAGSFQLNSLVSDILFSYSSFIVSSLFDVLCCHPLIYTPFGGLQSSGAGLARLAGVFSERNVRQRCPLFWAVSIFRKENRYRGGVVFGENWIAWSIWRVILLITDVPLAENLIPASRGDAVGFLPNE